MDIRRIVNVEDTKSNLRNAGRGIVMSAFAFTGLLFFALWLAGVLLLGLGIGLLLVPPLALALRWAVNLTRRYAGEWSGIEIPVPYRPEPPRKPGLEGLKQRTRWVLTDRASWRDAHWSLVNPAIGVYLLLIPAFLIGTGVFGLLMPFVWDDFIRLFDLDTARNAVVDVAGGGLQQPEIDDTPSGFWYGPINVHSNKTAWYAVLLGAPTLYFGLKTGPWALSTHARFARALLRPSGADRQLRHLTETRSEAINASAAELRRLERDLHDGAQARLIALGMNLGIAEQLLLKDPEAVPALLADTRKASVTALNELRDLIRGIHPPVLADRGLADAVRALAMDSPLAVDVSTELPGRPEAPVESALYFAVAEALSNAAKHAEPQLVTVDLWYADGRLRAQVSDDGLGGADPARGTGLRGIERRLATFDGVLAVTSPPGGPTTLTMELPCALS